MSAEGLPRRDGLPVLAEPEIVADTRCQTGEGPTWHPDEQALYWTDIPNGVLHRFDPASGRTDQVYQGESVGGITVQADGSLLLFGVRGSVRVWRDGQVVRTIVESIPGEQGTRFNDVIADPEGRVFAGTMATRDANDTITRPGTLYRFDLDGSYTPVWGGRTTPNGMGFTPDGAHLYATETTVGEQSIYRFRYERATGALADPRTWLQTPLDGSEGRPDGMTVDAEGAVWSARWAGGRVVRHAPDATPLGAVFFPAYNVSSLTFGGADYTDAYVTTAAGNDPGTHGPSGGALFRVRIPGVRGVPEFRSRIQM